MCGLVLGKVLGLLSRLLFFIILCVVFSISGISVGWKCLLIIRVVIGDRVLMFCFGMLCGRLSRFLLILICLRNGRCVL